MERVPRHGGLRIVPVRRYGGGQCDTKMNIEGPPFKAGPEWVSCGAPLPSEGTPLLQIATRLGPPKDLPVEADEMEVEHANPPLN